MSTEPNKVVSLSERAAAKEYEARKLRKAELEFDLKCYFLITAIMIAGDKDPEFRAAFAGYTYDQTCAYIKRQFKTTNMLASIVEVGTEEAPKLVLIALNGERI